MTLAEKIADVFSSRVKPAQVIADDVTQLDSDVDEALWFSGRDWHELTWQDWQEHSCAFYFFRPEAFAYYLPSLLVLAVQNQKDSLNAADSLISELDCSPDLDGWPVGLADRFLVLNSSELNVLKEWLLQVCGYIPYKGVGPSASGPGDRLGRAFDTLTLLQKEIEKRP